jgi:hypothetical protein
MEHIRGIDLDGCFLRERAAPKQAAENNDKGSLENSAVRTHGQIFVMVRFGMPRGLNHPPIPINPSKLFNLTFHASDQDTVKRVINFS